MSKRVCASMIVALLISSASAQDTLWTRNYGFTGESDQGMCGALTSDGGFLVAGDSGNFPGGDVWIVRADNNGDTIWTRNFGNERWQQANYITETSDGGVIAAGKFSVAVGDYDLYLIRLDPNGDSLWTRRFGAVGADDDGQMIIELADSNFLAVGNGRNAGTTDLFMVKLDTLGNQLWTKHYGGSGSEYAYGVVELADGGFMITGSTTTLTQGGSDLWLLRTDSDGDTLWTKKFDYHDGLDRGDNIVQADNGDFVIGGRTWNGTYAQLLGLRVDLSGNQIWAGEFGSLSDGEFAESIDKTSDGGFVIGGGKGISTFDFYVVRLDSNGDSLWAARYNGATGRSDDCYEIRVDSNDDILAFGYTDINSVAPSDLQFWVVKIDDGIIQPGNPDVDLLPMAFVDTVQEGNSTTGALYINNVGNATLYYGIVESESWITAIPDTGDVPAAEADTAVITFDASALAPGTHNGELIINSNDPDELQAHLPVTLVVLAGGCAYIPGDINGDGVANGIDVTFGVAYFKGGNPPPVDCHPFCPETPDPFYAAGDVNGSCSLNGIDITYFVAYLKGMQPALLFCPDCPPVTSGPRHSEIRGDCLGVSALDDSSYMYVEAIGNDLHIHHMYAFYQCCLEYFVDFQFAGNDITAVEQDFGPPCDCLCTFNLESILYDLAVGEYTVTLIGIYGDTVGVDTAYVGGY